MLNPANVRRVCGVIDLARGVAVHAVAGHRSRYQSVALSGGKPDALIQHYVNLGVRELYLADLDALTGQAMQQGVLERLISLGCDQGIDRILIDIAWSADVSAEKRRQVARMAATYSGVGWIAATESCESIEASLALADCVSKSKTWIGLDYHKGHLLSSQVSENDWMAVARQCEGVVPIDVATVGTACGPTTTEICRRVRLAAPHTKIYSGGGVRNAKDLQALWDAGCDSVLMASALHQFAKAPSQNKAD